MSEFGDILQRSRNITEEVYRDPLSYQLPQVLELFEQSKEPEQTLREFVEKHKFPLEKGKESVFPACYIMKDVASQFKHEYESTREDLFAIDATDSPVISTFVGQFYEVVVGGCGYKDVMSVPKIFRASATQKALVSGGDIRDLAEKLSQQIGGGDRSWPNTFREYKEREYAVDCEHFSIIVDGPILTQNLVTQAEGEKLTEKLLKSGKNVVGVIKNLSASTPLEQWIGRVLKDGEAFVISDCKTLLSQRNKAWGQSRSKAQWMNNVAAKYCRGVYRPGNPTGVKSKFFGFECRIDQLPWAIATLYKERSQVIGHEIPFLLDHIDAQLDAAHDRGSVQKRLEAALIGYNVDQAFDEISSDEFRGK